MSRERKSQVDDVAKLRKILDNPLDPTFKSLILKNEIALDSVRRRLVGENFRSRSYTDSYFHRYNSLEPRVTVHPQITSVPRITTPYPSYTPSVHLPEFTFVSSIKPYESASVQELSFSDEELFEIEKVENSSPEFLEVSVKENQKSPEKITITIDEQTQEDESGLPEWQPIQDIGIQEQQQPSEQLTDESDRDFDHSPRFLTPENEQTSIDSESKSIVPDESPVEVPIEFLPITEPKEPHFMLFSKKQIRASKKEQKKKNKEEKRRKKLELKRKKMEQREKERKNQESIPEEPICEQPRDERFLNDEEIQSHQTPQSIIDYSAFEGIVCIDKKITELLYKNGFFSIDNLRDATLDDLVQIQGIKRTLAKQIKKEIEQKIQTTDNSELVPSRTKKTKKRIKDRRENTTEWESIPQRQKKKQSDFTPYKYKGYTLYKRETKGYRGKKTMNHFFSKQKPRNGQLAPLPDGYRVSINRRTGIPYLRKRR